MARAMAGTAITNHTRGGVDYGTMTALVAFQDAPDIPYALGSGHVLAPRGAAVGDEIITAEGLLIGWLAGWTGERPDGITPHDADAALVQVIPSGVSPGVVGGTMTRTAAHRAFPGDSVRQFGAASRAAGFGAGAPGRIADVGRRMVVPVKGGAVCYAETLLLHDNMMPISRPGDSGAPVLDADGTLIGMVAAALFDYGNNPGYHGALPTIALPILNTLHHPVWGGRRLMKLPALHDSAPVAPVQPAHQPKPDPPAFDDRARAIDVLARTLWGEAAGEGGFRTVGAVAYEAVAWSVINRVRARRWWGRTVETVCTYPWQYSCWNPGTAARARLDAVTTADALFREARDVAARALDPGFPDPVARATHYFSDRVFKTTATWPKWARGRTPVAQVGAHVFFADVP